MVEPLVWSTEQGTTLCPNPLVEDQHNKASELPDNNLMFWSQPKIRPAMSHNNSLLLTTLSNSSVSFECSLFSCCEDHPHKEPFSRPSSSPLLKVKLQSTPLLLSQICAHTSRVRLYAYNFLSLKRPFLYIQPPPPSKDIDWLTGSEQKEQWSWLQNMKWQIYKGNKQWVSLHLVLQGFASYGVN